jgi:hypothetical protein
MSLMLLIPSISATNTAMPVSWLVPLSDIALLRITRPVGSISTSAP